MSSQQSPPTAHQRGLHGTRVQSVPEHILKPLLLIPELLIVSTWIMLALGEPLLYYTTHDFSFFQSIPSILEDAVGNALEFLTRLIGGVRDLPTTVTARGRVGGERS
ncbi:hypothetical protein MMC10_001950 [Thelotrema lepadinum]|nr:hypothetical protein [Thelotrema lepadinum]